MRARLPTRRVQAIHLASTLSAGEGVIRPDLPMPVGLADGGLIADSLGVLHLRALQRWITSHLLHPKRHRHRQLRVTAQCLRALLRWRCHSFLSGRVEMQRMCRRELVSTDASQISWGV
jgi:hypothetical protein